MEENRYIRGYDRAIFLQTCTARRIAEDLQLKMSAIIKHIRLKDGNEAADKKAVELTEIINRCQTEEEILEAIKEI